MAERKIISNKITKEKVQFLKTTKVTNGQYFQFELWVSPKGFMPMRHLHQKYKETVEVKSGIFKAECDGDIMYMSAGDAFTVDKGKPHQWWNESETEEVNTIFTITPAHKFETMLEQICGICNEKGNLSFWQITAVALSPIANLLGYKKFYVKYSQ